MKNIFSIEIKDNENSKMVGEHFITKKIDDELQNRYNQSLENSQNYEKKASLPSWLNLVKHIVCGFSIIVTISIISSIAEIGVEAFKNAPGIFIACLVGWAIFLTLFFIEKGKKKNVENDETFKQSSHEEDIITKKEFKERNGEQNVYISQLEEELFALENSAKDESDYFKNLQEIKKMFKKMYDPNSNMDKDEDDNLVKTLVDRIDVVPVSATEMRLEVKIKVSSSFKEMTYIRNGLRYGARSGNIVKKMIESYENSIK